MNNRWTFLISMALVAILLMGGDAWVAEVTPAPPPSMHSQWIGFAVSPNGRVFQSNQFDNEARARAVAAGECEHTSLHTCSSIAVVPEADVVAVKCGNKTFLGGLDAGQGRGHRPRQGVECRAGGASIMQRRIQILRRQSC